MRAPIGRASVAAVLIVLCLALLQFAEPATDTLMVRELQNAGHALLFGVIALLTLWGLTATGVSGPRAYLATLAVVLVLGGLSEYLQSFSPLRDASAGDWLRDAAGAVAFLCLAAWLRRDLGRVRSPVALLFLAGVCLAAVAVPVLLLWQDYQGRDAVFPVLCCFTGPWEQRFVRSNHLDLVPAAAPPGAHGDAFARMTFYPARWPGISVHEVYPDWSGYDTLAFDIYAEAAAPVALVLRVDDLGHDGVTFDDRFNRDLTVVAGLNRFRVPIVDILEAPRGRRMDPARMEKVFLFALTPRAPFTVYWNGLRLSREDDDRPDEDTALRPAAAAVAGFR